MVGWLHWSNRGGWRPKVSQTRLMGLPLLEAALPQGGQERRLAQGAKALRRRGIRRVLLSPGIEGAQILDHFGLQGIDPLPLYRAKGAELALTLVRQVPLRERRVALRGTAADALAWQIAERLSQKAGTVLLDFQRGEEALAEHLLARYGAVPLHLGLGLSPQVSIELEQCGTPVGRPLRLWGTPELHGLELAAEGEFPPEVNEAALLTLLWETGRRSLEEIWIRRAAE